MGPAAGQRRGREVPQPLHIEVIRKPHPEAEREAALAACALADALADPLIARARREVASERGVAAEDIDREHKRVAEAARALWWPAGRQRSALSHQRPARTGRPAEG